MKNKLSLITLIDYLTEKANILIKKIGRFANNKNKQDTVYIFTKIIMTLIVLALLNIPFVLLENLGIFIIYEVGTTLRAFLSVTWKIIVNISYILLCLIIIFNVFASILDNKELNFIEENRRKDTRLKKNVFIPLINFIKACSVILTVPLFLMIIIIMIMLGMDLALLTHGYKFFSLFLILVGSLLMITSVILIIFDIISINSKSKKYINILLSGLLVFVSGIISINFELAQFTSLNTLPDAFNIKTEEISIKIDDLKEYQIKKAKYNENINISKYEDNSLGDEILIKTNHTPTSIVKNTLSVDENEVDIIFSNSLDLDTKDLKDIYNLIIKSITSETIYNYNLIKYSDIEIYGNEEVLARIEIEDYED